MSVNINSIPEDRRCECCLQPLELQKTFVDDAMDGYVSAIWLCGSCIKLPDNIRRARHNRMVDAERTGNTEMALRITNQLDTLYATMAVIFDDSADAEQMMADLSKHSVKEEIWLLNMNEDVKELEDQMKELLIAMEYIWSHNHDTK